MSYHPRHVRRARFRLWVTGFAVLGTAFSGFALGTGKADAAEPVSWQDTSLLVVQPTNNAFVHRYTLACVSVSGGGQASIIGGEPAAGHSVTWSLSGASADTVIDPSTGLISDTTAGGDPDVSATTDVKVTASDGYGDIANAVVDLTRSSGTLTVPETDSTDCVTVHFPPAEQSGGVQFSTDPDQSRSNEVGEATESSSTEAGETETGPDGTLASVTEGITWSATGLPGNLAIDSNGFITPTGGNAAPGNYGVKVTATDASGAASTITFTLQVNAQPVFQPGNLGDEVNKFGNGFDVFQQHFAYNAVIAGWTATKSDPATHFIRIPDGTGWQFEAVNGKFIATGLCVSMPGYDAAGTGVPTGLVLRHCSVGNPWQEFMPQADGTLKDAATGLLVNPAGTGAQLRGGTAPSPWGGSFYQWMDLSQLP